MERLFVTQDEMRMQMFPNGGASLADKVVANIASSAIIVSDIMFIKANIERMNARQRLLMDALDFGVMEFDQQGRCLQVNKWLLTQMRLHESDFIGRAWMNLVEDEEFETHWERVITSRATIKCALTLRSNHIAHKVLFYSFHMYDYAYVRITFLPDDDEGVSEG